MYRLISPHVNHVVGGVPEVLGEWRAPGVVLLHPFPELRWLRGAYPQARIVVRAFPDDSHNPDFNDPNLNPTLAAMSFVGLVLQRIGNYPCTHIQMTNEPAISSRAAMARLAEFDAECAYQMGKRGRRITLANLATGNPSDMSWWHEYKVAIAQGIQNDAVLLLHAYTWPGQDDRWLLYRHRMVYDGCPEHGWEGLSQNLRIPCLLGEVGYDYGVAEPGIRRGFRQVPGMDEQKYAAWLEGVDRELMQDPYIVGGAVFCMSALDKAKWSGYDIWEEPARSMARVAEPVYRGFAMPNIVNLVGKLPVNPDVPYDTRWTKNVKWTVAHHSGGRAVINKPVQHIRAMARYHIRRYGWPGLQYHFCIAQDGTIYRTAKDAQVCYNSGNDQVNRQSYAVCYLGNFTKSMPTMAQIAAGRVLMQWLGKTCIEHRDVVPTACPGWDVC